MLDQALAASGVVILATAGLLASNFLFDRGVPGTVSRRAAPVLGGAAFLIAVLWLDAWTAIALAGVLSLSILALRLGFRRTLRGISRSVSTQDWAEAAYPMAGAAGLAVGWGLLGDRWLAFVPIAFMAWGDSAAGLVRSSIRSGNIAWPFTARICRGNMAIVWPSIAMLGVCLIVASPFQPYWIAALGAIVATAAERFRLIAHGLWNDSWLPDDPVIVAASLAVMGILARTSM